MPLYEYQCEKCGVRFEVIRRFADAPLETCQDCGGKVQRLLSAPAIQFKGSGWYITDYARKGKGEPATASTGGSNGNGAGPADAAGGKSDGKPEEKPQQKPEQKETTKSS